MPLLNVIDLTKRSENIKKLRQNGTTAIKDLESEIVVDSHLSQDDLAIVEIEVNKKRKKK